MEEVPQERSSKEDHDDGKKSERKSGCEEGDEDHIHEIKVQHGAAPEENEDEVPSSCARAERERGREREGCLRRMGRRRRYFLRRRGGWLWCANARRLRSFLRKQGWRLATTYCVSKSKMAPLDSSVGRAFDCNLSAILRSNKASGSTRKSIINRIVPSSILGLET